MTRYSRCLSPACHCADTAASTRGIALPSTVRAAAHGPGHGHGSHKGDLTPGERAPCCWTWIAEPWATTWGQSVKHHSASFTLGLQHHRTHRGDLSKLQGSREEVTGEKQGPPRPVASTDSGTASSAFNPPLGHRAHEKGPGCSFDALFFCITNAPFSSCLELAEMASGS